MEIDDRKLIHRSISIDNDWLIDIDWYRPVDDQSTVTNEISLIATIAIDNYRLSSITIGCINLLQCIDGDDDYPQDVRI